MAPAFSIVIRVATLVCPVSVGTPTFFPASCASWVMPLLVITKDLGKSDVGIARMTMSRPLRTSSATGTDPVWANSQSPRMSPAAASGPPTAMAGRVISIPRFLKRPASAPSQAVLCHVARSPVATRTAPPGLVGGDCAQAKRETEDRAVAPAARCKNFRRGSFTNAPWRRRGTRRVDARNENVENGDAGRRNQRRQ